MGRGRQKAKHTKLARELKSYSPDLNYGALERELGHGEEGSIPPGWEDFGTEDQRSA
jgi:hypothetical protein